MIEIVLWREMKGLTEQNYKELILFYFQGKPTEIERYRGEYMILINSERKIY